MNPLRPAIAAMASMTVLGGAFAWMRAWIAAASKIPVSASSRRTTSANGFAVQTSRCSTGTRWLVRVSVLLLCCGCIVDSLLGSRPPTAEGLVNGDQSDGDVPLALDQLILGGIYRALRVEYCEEALQPARVSLSGQLESAAVRGDRGAQQVLPLQLVLVRRESVLDFLECDQDAVLV